MTTQELSQPTATTGGLLVTAAIICTVYQAFALILLHVLRADLAPYQISSATMQWGLLVGL